MFRLKYISPDGVVFPLIGGPYTAAFVTEDGVEDLVGLFEDTGVHPVGVAGRRVDFRDRQVMEATGSLTVVVHDPGLWPEFMAAWSTRREGTLVLEGESRFELPVRLAESVRVPSRRPAPGVEVSLPLVSDGGVWLSSVVTDTENVTVTNWGDVNVWPHLVWEGAGGAVTLPSGARLTLPKVSGLHEVSLDPMDGGEVVRLLDGTVDDALSREVGAVGESVPVGENRTYTLPKGVSLCWRVGVFNPWR